MTTSIVKSWPKDSYNGKLSYSKMVYEVTNAHPRELVDGHFEKMSCCRARTGCFGCTKNCRRSENISSELGIGMTIYFKTMKSFVLLFAVFTIFSIPAYYLYWNGTTTSDSSSR